MTKAVPISSFYYGFLILSPVTGFMIVSSRIIGFVTAKRFFPIILGLIFYYSSDISSSSEDNGFDTADWTTWRAFCLQSSQWSSGAILDDEELRWALSDSDEM